MVVLPVHTVIDGLQFGTPLNHRTNKYIVKYFGSNMCVDNVLIRYKQKTDKTKKRQEPW